MAARFPVLLLFLIVYGSLYPFSFGPRHSAILEWAWGADINALRDATLNLCLYLPVGFLIALTARRPILTATLLAAAVSAACECLQAFDLGRVSSLLDLLLNTTGAFIGALLATRLRPTLSPAMGVVILAIGARIFPFLPNLHPHLGSFQAGQALFAIVDWLALGCALKSPRRLALFMLVIPARLFILDQTASLGEIVGALLALIASTWITQPRYLAPMMLLSLVARELAPFRFAAAPQVFNWIPFASVLSAPSGAVVFLAKLSIYSTALWLVRPNAKQLARPAVALAGLIFLLEWLQRYIPGRTPDISDALILLLGAVTLSYLATTAGPHSSAATATS